VVQIKLGYIFSSPSENDKLAVFGAVVIQQTHQELANSVRSDTRAALHLFDSKEMYEEVEALEPFRRDSHPTVSQCLLSGH
jgi:hypothetical protein